MSHRLFVRLSEDELCGPESDVPMATLRGHEIQTRLKPHVAHILSYQETLAPGEELVERVLPDGAVRLILNAASHTSSGDGCEATTTVLGPSAAPALVRLQGRLDGLSMTLKPGACEVLFGIPAGELTGLAVPLRDLWPVESPRLAHVLSQARSVEQRLATLQIELGRRIVANPPPGSLVATQALELMRNGAGQQSLSQLATAVGLGERRLQQLFKTHLGLTPNAWRRLVRMHACLRALRRSPWTSWTELAHDAGFYDQSHLINEFRKHSGLTPSEFRCQAISGSSKTPGG